MPDLTTTVSEGGGSVDEHSTAGPSVALASEEPRSRWYPTSDRLALWLFVAFVIAAAPLILFHYGAYHWFFRDDLEFLTERKPGHWPPLLDPHGGAHLSVVPRLVYFALWELFGMRRYLPYQASVVALHLTVAVLLRAVMRRVGVNAWLASATAAILVLFGPGAQNIVWAFQIGFTGSLACGLAQLLVADHDGTIGRRDALALGFGALAVLSSGVGVATTVAVGIALLIRRGWKPAALQTVPFAVFVAVWAKVYDAGAGPFSVPASVRQLVAWAWSTFVGTFEAIGAFGPLSVALLLLVLAGFAVSVTGATRPAEELRRFALPLGLLAGGVAFAFITAWGRAGSQPVDQARSARYLYIVAAMCLPLIALCLQGLARRYPRLLPLMVVLLLIPIPFNTRGFTPDVFGPRYMQDRARILTTAPRLGFASEVPDDVEPVPDPFTGHVTIKFLRDALRHGKLRPSSSKLDERTRNEFRIRLGLEVRSTTPNPARLQCQKVRTPVPIRVPEGQTITLAGPARLSTRSGGVQTSPWVSYQGGNLYFPMGLKSVLTDLDLRVASGTPGPVPVCITH